MTRTDKKCKRCKKDMINVVVTREYCISCLYIRQRESQKKKRKQKDVKSNYTKMVLGYNT